MSVVLGSSLNTAEAEVPLGSTFVGIDRPNWQVNATQNVPILNRFETTHARVAMDYRQSASELDDIIDLLEDDGIKPVILVEYYQYYGDLKHNQSNIRTHWYNLGRSLALRHGSKISHYTAINEPDLYLWVNNGTDVTVNDPRAIIPLNDYRAAIEGFADGVHSVNASFKVFPGGYASWLFHGDHTNRGYSSVLAPLFNDGTLDGIDIHNYNTDLGDYNRSAQILFQKAKEQSGITSDINFYCTEFNAATGNAGAKQFLTKIWDHLGLVGNSGNAKTQFAMPFSLFGQENIKSWGLAAQLNPWTPTVRAKVWEMLLPLIDGVDLELLDPLVTGTFVLRGNGKKIWVWQNRGAYSDIAGGTFPLTRIPSNASTLEVYRYDSSPNVPFRTINLDGRENRQLTNLPTDQTLLFVANSGSNQTFTDLKIDFDKASTPTEPEYLRFEVAGYSPALGYGWNNPSGILSRDRNSGGSLFRDIHMDNEEKVFLIDVANGRYRIRLFIGDKLGPKDNIDIEVEGVAVFNNVSTAPGEVKTLEFETDITDGQVSIGIHDDDAGDFWTICGIELEALSSGGPETGVWYNIRNKSHGGNRNLTADSSGSGWNVITTTNAGWWTQWRLIDAGNSYFFFRNRGHGETRNLRAANSGESWNVNSTTNALGWEQWRLIDVGGGYYNLRNKGHDGNRNLRAGNSRENWNVNTTTATLDWEQWRFVD
ncbi:MAG: hypothetical protein AAF558_01840 [Verrucomicrobiota bacterium]